MKRNFLGKGVSACATCDGFFYKNKKVCVVGGGNTAVEEALYLSNIASSVTLVHRRDSSKGRKNTAGSTFSKKIILKLCGIPNYLRVKGDNMGVTSAVIKSKKDGSEQDISFDGVFIAIGHKPNTDIFTRSIRYGRRLYHC